MSVKDFSYKREVLRKIIHFSSSVFAFMLFFLGKSICIPLFIIIAILFFVADFLRLKNQYVQNIYNIFFDVVTRNSEKNRITGASYVFLSIVLVTLLFDVKIAVASLLIMSFADPVASLMGRAFGNFIILNKTIEGSVSFFIVSVIVLSVFDFSSETILYVSIFCTLIELVSNKIKIDDNLLVPLSSAVLLFIF
tara:strand:- start:122 stop:703 length:582 start_codon:yes stop_codon:yes gene_type:complete